AKISLIAGKANVDLQVTAAGANQLQLVESLNGTAGFAFADGAIVGTHFKIDGNTWNGDWDSVAQRFGTSAVRGGASSSWLAGMGGGAKSKRRQWPNQPRYNP
ncbi:MAG: hypothetical protein HC933_12230, partial [Pleurocapsa sp. SU_196_0]|nr:hypothetical protein [Pleurocapsa sp. SU_196_0]